MQLNSTLTCPQCGHQSLETMPTDACQFFYDCNGLRNPPQAQTGRLLRVLLVRVCPVPADPAGRQERVL